MGSYHVHADVGMSYLYYALSVRVYTLVCICTGIKRARVCTSFATGTTWRNIEPPDLDSDSFTLVSLRCTYTWAQNFLAFHTLVNFHTLYTIVQRNVHLSTPFSRSLNKEHDSCTNVSQTTEMRISPIFSVHKMA